MNSNLTKLIDIYSKAYDCTKQIDLFIDADNYDEINKLLKIREPLLIEGSSIRKKETFSKDEKAKIDETIAGLKSLDQQNFEKMQKKRVILEKEFGNVSKNQRAMSAYRIKTETSSIIFDSKN